MYAIGTASYIHHHRAEIVTYDKLYSSTSIGRVIYSIYTYVYVLTVRALCVVHCACVGINQTKQAKDFTILCM